MVKSKPGSFSITLIWIGWCDNLVASSAALPSTQLFLRQRFITLKSNDDFDGIIIAFGGARTRRLRLSIIHLTDI